MTVSETFTSFRRGKLNIINTLNRGGFQVRVVSKAIFKKI